MSKAASRGRQTRRVAARSPAPTMKLPFAALGVVVALLFGAFVALTSGGAPKPEAIGGPFSLVDQNGAPVSDKDLIGKPFLVFFGYTHCPDVCHAAVFEMSEALRAMGPSANAAALFVTVDPERDTPVALKEYLSSFDPRVIGLTGARAALDPMLKEYRIYAKRQGQGDEYSVDHNSTVYLMDKQGHFVKVFNLSRSPQEAAKELASYL